MSGAEAAAPRETALLPAQEEITATFDEAGTLTLTQTVIPFGGQRLDDRWITVTGPNLATFINSLTRLMDGRDDLSASTGRRRQ